MFREFATASLTNCCLHGKLIATRDCWCTARELPSKRCVSWEPNEDSGAAPSPNLETFLKLSPQNIAKRTKCTKALFEDLELG